jgi:hypothetical protein
VKKNKSAKIIFSSLIQPEKMDSTMVRVFILSMDEVNNTIVIGIFENILFIDPQVKKNPQEARISPNFCLAVCRISTETPSKF